MTEPNDTPAPGDEPLAAREDEVDRLLSEASVLADEITSEAGAEPPDRQAEASGQDPGAIDSKDTQAAAEDVESTLGELERMLGDAEAAAEAGDLRGAEPDSPSALEPADAAQEHASSNSKPVSELEATARGVAEADLPAPGDDAGEPEEAQRGETADSGGEDNRTPLLAASFQKLAAAARLVKHVAYAASSRALAWLARPLIILDRPFANMDLKKKQFIGYAALITLAAGIASLVLPALLDHNPYLEIGR